MALSEDTHRRRRRRRFWRKLRNPRTVMVILRVAIFIYRIVRWLMAIFGSPG